MRTWNGQQLKKNCHTSKEKKSKILQSKFQAENLELTQFAKDKSPHPNKSLYTDHADVWKRQSNMNLFICHSIPFQVFDANNDPYNVTEITLDVNGILTRFVRIYPINCVRAGVPDSCLMRFEILGCVGQWQPLGVMKCWCIIQVMLSLNRSRFRTL